MIKKLNWDTEFFGYPVGSIRITGVVTDDILSLLSGCNDFKIVYVFSENELPREFDKYYVGKSITYYKKIEERNKDVVVNRYESNIDSYKELLSLTYQCGLFSRFNVDSNFKNNEYRRLYKKWIDKSLNELNRKVLVTEKDSHLTGFITVDFLDDANAKLGLIAVDKKHQSKGIGSELIKMAENEAFDAEKYHIRVTTHFDNKPAMWILEKAAYKVDSSSYIYHLWNQ